MGTKKYKKHCTSLLQIISKACFLFMYTHVHHTCHTLCSATLTHLSSFLCHQTYAIHIKISILCRTYFLKLLLYAMYSNYLCSPICQVKLLKLLLWTSMEMDDTFLEIWGSGFPKSGSLIFLVQMLFISPGQYASSGKTRVMVTNNYAHIRLRAIWRLPGFPGSIPAW